MVFAFMFAQKEEICRICRIL